MSRGRIPSTPLARSYPRPPMSTSPSAPRSFGLRRPPGSTPPAASPGSRGAGRRLAPRVGGQLLAAQEDGLGQAARCIAFAVSRFRSQRALIDDDVADNMLGQGRVAESQERLPVQPGGVTLVDVPVAGRSSRAGSTDRAVLTGSHHEAPRSSAASPSAGAIDHRGPERLPDTNMGPVSGMKAGQPVSY